ncbi:unnamed protein product, partial [Staurois parvus]
MSCQSAPGVHPWGTLPHISAVSSVPPYQCPPVLPHQC